MLNNLLVCGELLSVHWVDKWPALIMSGQLGDNSHTDPKVFVSVLLFFLFGGYGCFFSGYGCFFGGYGCFFGGCGCLFSLNS
jgi:hypothetical protein